MSARRHPVARPESARRLRGRAASAAAVALLLMAAILGLVGLRLQEIRLSYKLDTLHRTRHQMEELTRQLQVELAMLRSPARIEREARSLGLTAPTPRQVRLAREYVMAGAGATSLQVAQTRPPGVARLPARP